MAKSSRLLFSINVASSSSLIFLDDLSFSFLNPAEELSSMRAGDDDHSIEAYYLEIKEGGEKGSTEYGHKGKELGIILEGEGEFIIGNKSYKLGEGDSISFESDVPHVLKNTGDRPLKAYWMITPPKMFFREV